MRAVLGGMMGTKTDPPVTALQMLRPERPNAPVPAPTPEPPVAVIGESPWKRATRPELSTGRFERGARTRKEGPGPFPAAMNGAPASVVPAAFSLPRHREETGS